MPRKFQIFRIAVIAASIGLASCGGSGSQPALLPIAPTPVPTPAPAPAPAPSPVATCETPAPIVNKAPDAIQGYLFEVNDGVATATEAPRLASKYGMTGVEVYGGNILLGLDSNVFFAVVPNDALPAVRCESSIRTVFYSSPSVTSSVTTLQMAAAAKEVESREAASPTPCTEDSQCSVIGFATTGTVCPDAAYLQSTLLPYSLISATARQAETAAAVQHRYIFDTKALLPYDGIACPAVVYSIRNSCVANKCTTTVGN